MMIGRVRCVVSCNVVVFQCIYSYLLVFISISRDFLPFFSFQLSLITVNRVLKTIHYKERFFNPMG